MKRVLFFGIFDPAYPRSSILKDGFEALGYEVIECRVDPRAIPGVKKYYLLWRKGREIQYNSFDHVLVLFPGHTAVWLARILFGNRIIFDAFVSLHDSNVYDRARYTTRSIGALKDRFLDRLSCSLARIVLVDTKEHRRYFKEYIGVPLRKCIVVPVGATTMCFRLGGTPVTAADEAVTSVVFYGSYIPLHGIPYIVKAAELLIDEPIQFTIIGGGQEWRRVQALVSSLPTVPRVEFVSALPYLEMLERVRHADICLGIFGNTDKTQRVISNKVYECAALGKAIITADTPAIHEAFTPGENSMVCEPASPTALAKAIISLSHDKALQQRLGHGARQLMEEKFTPERLVRDLLGELAGPEFGSMAV
jgi:glycosyltransferase involved in cell wall biosynthesis